ncbi:hypothetical protein FJR11_14510 [Anabaena sp. UHCC 0187]|uniref:hypothetical protein n=1 Tax=Anabaena sp. UHCC 0187 TaxID=2590018 RepID=UPI0014458E3B|nr:hypothetical protein [Anabaena sp. UHCC 0187]MTJ13778.1 hypothetical protein [Anabaena sp. UHCC 0187]
MNLFTQNLPEPGMSPNIIQENPPSGTDLLISHGLQKEQYIGIIALVIALITAVGFFSRRVEYAILVALFLSAFLISLFLFL